MVVYAVGIISFLITAILHALLSRLNWKANAVVKFLVAAGFTGLFLVYFIAREVYMGEALLMEALAVVLAYACLCELYIFFFSLVMASISVSFLLSLRRGPLSRAEFDHISTSHDMVSGRLENLVRVGFLERTQEGLVLSVKGRFLVAVFGLLRGFFFPHSFTDKSGILRDG